jgi:signal transduction histidine kinase
VLERVGKRFNASQVIYYCTVASENYYSWRTDQSIKPPDKRLRDLLWENEVKIENGHLYIPIKSPESHWGILCISFPSEPDPRDLDPNILLALGHQMAILIENIQVFSNIRFQNDLLQSIVEGICDPLLLIDPECRIIVANKGCNQILSDSGKALREKELKGLLSLKPIPEAKETLLGQVILKETPVGGEIKAPDNRYFSINLYPLPRQDQMGLRIVVHIREITLEKQMVKRMQQAERLSATGKLAAGIAHEINNPLGVIQLYTDLVKDAVTSPDTLDDLAVISKHTRSVQKIIRDLLTLSRPKQVISGRCSINTVVTSIFEVFKIQGASKNISISFDLETPLPDIKCDAAILEQILTNLWLNAFDAMDKKNGSIHITTQRSSEDMVLLSVEDNGQGIPKDVISHIFDPFYTTKEIGKGTGLGLSVVYGFITELGGRIDVESDGTTRFKVFFPLLENENRYEG